MAALRPRWLRAAERRPRTRNARAARAQVVAGDVGARGRGRHRSAEPRSSHATGTRSTGPRLSTRIDLEDVHGRGAPSPRGARRDRPAGAGGDVPHRLAAGLAAVRVNQLLGHTSGVPDFWFVPEAARLVADPTARATDLARVMAREPLQFEPGSRFSYSNTAYHAAARIIERSQRSHTTCSWRASSSRRSA